MGSNDENQRSETVEQVAKVLRIVDDMIANGDVDEVDNDLQPSQDSHLLTPNVSLNGKLTLINNNETIFTNNNKCRIPDHYNSDDEKLSDYIRCIYRALSPKKDVAFTNCQEQPR